MSARPPAPRVRQARARANDAVILEAAEAILADDGWEDAAVLRVADRAQLSRRAVLSRYGDRTGVVAETWREVVSADLRAALQSVIDVSDRDGTPIDLSRLRDALQPFFDPSTSMRAAAEVLAIASFQRDIADAVNSSLADDWQRWLAPSIGGYSPTEAARHAFLVALALGVLFEGRGFPDGTDMDADATLQFAITALNADFAPSPLPTIRATYLDEEPVLDDEPGIAALLAATLSLVGREGYEAATLDRIAAECGRTSGFIFGHYPNKRVLFIDATDRLLPVANASAQAFLETLSAEHSWGIADATLTREFLRPEHRSLRTVATEQYRLSWHDPDFLDAFHRPRAEMVANLIAAYPELTPRTARGRAFIAFARGIGYGLLGNLYPPVIDLPHDVVSRPLYDASA